MTVDIIHIVCCTDHGYIMPTCIMIFSCAVNHPSSSVRFHVVINSSVNSSDQSFIREAAGQNNSVCFYDADAIECNFPKIGVTNKHVTKASYYRCFLASLLPNNISKVIYLDGDIVVKAPLYDLWNFIIEDYAIGCVKDMDEKANLNRIKYSVEYGYFNAGVLLINLNYWRTHAIEDRFRTFMEEHGDLIVYHDQDVLNYTLFQEKLQIPLKYNVQNGFLFRQRYRLFDNENGNEFEEARCHPVIVHFTLAKPWYRVSISPFKNDFLRFYDSFGGRRIKKLKWFSKTGLRNNIREILENVKLYLKYDI